MTTQRQVNLMFTANTKQAQQEIQALQTSLTNIANMPVTIGGAAMTKNIKDASLAAMELKTHLQNATNISTGTLDFSKLNTSLQASNVSLSQYASKLLSIGPAGRQAFMQLANSVAQAEVPIRRSNTMLSTMMTTLKNTAKWQLASTAIHGVAGAISSAYGYAQRLDESLNNIRIVTGKSAEEMRKFAKSANEAAKALSASTTEYTNASLIYYQQGLSDQQVKERTDVTIKMANVARESSEVVSNQLTAIWNNFDDGSKALEYYADVITALGAATASSSSEISDGLEKFASVAKTVGLSYEYATAALATVTATTRQSADVVGTAFKTLFARLQDLKLGETLDDGTTLGTYTQHLAKVGVQIQDASGQLKDMDVILDEVAAKWDELDRGQQVALAKGVAGIRQYNTFLSLMSNWDFMEKNLETVAESGGTLQKQADIYAESWEAAKKQVKASMESLYQNLIDPEFFKKLSEGIEKVVSVVDFLSKSLGGLSGILSTVSVLLLKTFSNQVATSIRNIATNIYTTSQYGQQQIQQQKSAQISEMSRMMANTRTGTGDISSANRVASTEYSTQLTMQQQLIDNQANMDQSQIANCQQILDLRRQIGDKIMESAKQEENATTNIKNLYSDMLTQKAAAMVSEGKTMGSDDVRQLMQRKQALDDAITSQQRLEYAIEEYKQALIANDAASDDEKMDMEEKAQAAERYRRATEALGAALKKANPGMDSQGINGIIQGVATGTRTDDVELEHQSLQQSRLNLTKQVSAATNELTQNEKVAQETVLQMSNSIRERNNKQQEQNNLIHQGTDLQDKYNKKIGEGRQSGGDWAKSITAGAQSLMSLVSAMQIASGLIDTLTNPDATGWEKFIAVLSSGSMIIMMLMSAMSSFDMMRQQWEKGALRSALATTLDMAATKLNTAAQRENTNAKTANNAITVKDTADNYSHATSEVVDAGASKANTGSKSSGMKSLGQSFKNFGSAFKGFMATYGAGIGLIAAGVAIAVGAIAWGINQFKKYENAAKEAAKQAEEAANAYKSVSEAYNSFTSNLDSYSNAKSGLEDITKGTLEYREAVLKANESAMQLLNTCENLEYTIDEDGLIVIDQASLEQAQKEQLKILENAQRARQLADQNAKNKELEAKTVKFQREELDSGEGRQGQFGNGLAATGAGLLSGVAIGAGAGMVAGGGVFSLPAAIIGGVAGGLIGAVSGAVGATLGTAADEEKEAIDRLAEVYATTGNAKFASDTEFRNLLENELQIKDGPLIDSLVANRESTLELVKEVSANTQALNTQNAATVKQYYSDQLKNSGLDEAAQSAIASRAGALLDEKTEELYQNKYKDKFGGKTDAEVQKAYAAAMGWATDTIDNQNGNKAKYFNKDGTEVGVISDEVARRYLAEQEALKALEKTTKALTSKFKELENSSDKYDKALLSYMENKDFSDLTEEEYNSLYGLIAGKDGSLSKEDVQQYINDEFNGGYDLTDSTAQQYGYDTAEQFYNDFFDKLNLYEEHRNSANNNIANYAKNLINNSSVTSTMSTKELEMMGKQVNQALINSGENAAQYVANTFYKKAEGEAEKVAKALDTVDWSTVDAETLSKTLAEAGVATSYTTDELNTLIDYMVKDASSSIEDVQNKLKVLDEINDLTQGSTISSDQYSALNDELQSYFTLMADGTYKLTQNALDFYQAVNQEQKKLLTNEIKLMEVEFGIANDIAAKGREDYFKDLVSKDKRWQEGVPEINEVNYQKYLDEAVGATGLMYRVGVGSGAEANGMAGSGLNYNTRSTTETITLKTPNGTQTLDVGARVHDTSDAGFGDDGRGTIKIIRPKKDNNGKIKTTMAGGYESVDYETVSVELSSYEAWSQNMQIKRAENKANTKTTADQNKIIADQLLLLGQSTNKETLTLVENWKTALSNGTLSLQQAEDIYKKVAAEGEEIYTRMKAQAKETERQLQIYKNTLALQAQSAQERDDLLGKGTINEQAYWLAVSSAHDQELMENLDVQTVNKYAEHLENAAYASDLLFDNMSKETMEDVAAYTMKMNRGIETLSSNFENWNDILRNSNASSVEFAESLSGMKAAMSDVLGVSEEFLSDNFMLSELEDIELAAQGDADAINRLAMAASRDILFNIGLSSGKELQAEILQIHDDLMLNMPDVEVGASLRHADFQKILDTAQMTVEEAQAYFNALGYEPTFVTVEEEVPLQGTRTYTTNVVTNKTSGGFEYIESSDTVTEPVDMDKTQKVQVPVLSGDGVPTLKHITKKSDGAMNNSSSANAGGSGAKKAKPIKQTKKTDIVDRYKEVTDAIDDVENALNDASKAADRLYGAARLKQLEKQKKLIEDEVKLLKQKKAEAQANLLIDRQALSDAAKSAGVSLDIDEKGNITNYTEKMNALSNELTERENKANEITNQEQQDKYIEKYVEPLRNIIQELKKAMSQYEETRELLEDVDDLIDDKWDAWQDTNYEELHYKLELQLEINDRDLQEIDYYLNKIQNDFYKMAEGAAYFFDKLKVYQNGSSSDETFLNELTEKYNSFNKDGIRNISNTDYFKGLQEVFDNALSNAQAIKELDDTMLDYYGNTLAAAGEELVKYTDRMEHQTAALEHYKNIMSIIGKSTDYKSMGVILENQAKTIENELAVIKGNYEMLAGEADYWKQMMESVDETDPAFAVYKANWEAAESATRDAQANMLSKTEEWAEAMKAIMENKLSDLAQTLENNLTGGTSFETISSQIERASSLQEEYLTTTNKIYETNKMINTAQQAIDKTSNTIAKQKLKSFQQETAQLQNKKKLSQYELEIQQAKYDLLLAEIALEEAQQAKSTVRLQRDSEGNFGYVYTADATQISEAEQKLADAQNNLYNIGLEGANNYTQKYQETMQEMYDTLTELQIQYLNGEFETEEEYHNAVEEAKAYYYQKLSDYSHLYQEAVAADSRVIADAWSSDFADMTYNTENWKSNVENYLNDIDLAFDGWEKTVDRIKNETVGNDLDELKTKVGNIVTESNKLAEAITKKDGVLDGLKNMINKVGDATLKWGEQRGVVLDLIEYYENLANQAKKAQDAIRWDEGNNTPTPNPVPPEVPGSVGGDGNLNEVGVKPESEPSTKPTNPSETFDPNTLPAGLRTTVTLYSSPSYGGGMGEHPIWAGYFSLEKSGYGTGKPGSAYSGYYLKNQYGLSGYISNSEAKRLVDEKYIRNTNFTFDTGGYTGQWGQSGKWALLHEKELVLNADDTTNFLASLEVLREIVNTINLHSMNAQLGGLLNSPNHINSNNTQTLEQQVTIEAHFPNASDRNEIEEAFGNLINLASQYVNRK